MLLLSWVRSCARRKLPNPDLLASKRCFLGGTDTSGGLETLRQLSGLLTDGGRRKKREIDFASRNISAFVPAWSTVFRESSIELGSVAPSSVVNPADAVQIIGGRPVIGSERIRRHARRKVREPRPPQRHLSIQISRHKCLFAAPPLGGATCQLQYCSVRWDRPSPFVACHASLQHGHCSTGA